MAESSTNPVPASQQPPPWYKESRKKDPSNAGSIVFTLLRLLEVPWQYYFLGSGLGTSLLTRLGARLEALPAAPTSPADAIGLHPYHAIILGLAAGTSASQIFWVWAIRDNYFPPPGATAVASYNTVLNTVNSTLALWAATSQAPTRRGFKLYWSLACVVGLLLYIAGTYLERKSEMQRKQFKAKPENKGKPFSGGLFGWVRNANYTGYALMRTGFALVCGGWAWGAVMGAIVFSDFAFRAVPWLDGYCAERVSLCSSCW